MCSYTDQVQTMNFGCVLLHPNIGSQFGINETVDIHYQLQQHTVIFNLTVIQIYYSMDEILSSDTTVPFLIFFNLLFFLALYLNPYAINILYLPFFKKKKMLSK